jgi:hypothetical protein
MPGTMPAGGRKEVERAEPAEPETQSRQWPPEPWSCRDGMILDADGWQLPDTALNRIVACVNAMAGILEPVAFMERAGRPTG